MEEDEMKSNFKFQTGFSRALEKIAGFGKGNKIVNNK